MFDRSLLTPARLRAQSEQSGAASLAEAREALAFWSARAARLPWHRRAARREARIMVSRWHARLLRAQLERWRLGFLARALAPLGQTLATTNGAHARRLLVRLVWGTALGRRALIAAAALAIACLSALVLFAAVASQLLPL